MLRTWLVVGAVFAVGVAAALEGLRGDRAGSDASGEPPAVAPEIDGADVPQPGALPGLLTFAGEECGLERLDLAALTITKGVGGESCSFWLSPDGDQAVLGYGPPADREAWVVQLDAGSASARLGPIQGEASWSPDGTRVAWCDSGGTTSVVTLADSSIGDMPGCYPRFGASGDLFSVAGGAGAQQLLRNGVAVLRDAQLREGFPPAAGPVRVLGYDERTDGLLAVAVASGPGTDRELSPQLEFDLSDAGPFGPVNVRPPTEYRRFVLELWRDGRLERAVPLRGLAYPFVNLEFGEVLRFSPRGDELAIGSSGEGVPVMLVDVETLQPLLRPTVQQGFAWSPDGAWFALADPLGIRIAGAVRDLPAYVLPVSATSLAWR